MALSPTESSLPFAQYAGAVRAEIEAAFERALPGGAEEPERLHEAMRYAVLGGGKRVRGMVVLAACEACGGTRREAMPAALALECVHAYSLVHDDLPAMDDDDLRRGRPTVHRRYDEATAVLVGDALLTLAFGLLGRLRPAERSVACVIELARGAGSVGMAGGQMLDIQSEGGERSAGRLAAIHTMKTAALIRSSAVCGALAAGAPDGRVAALALYGEKVGLAFQVVDDILDCEGTPETLGKPSGRDAEEGKLTYPAVFGLEASKLRARSLMEEGLAALAPLGEGGRRLREIAEFVVTRTK